MKKLIAIAAVATALASPAFAQSYDPSVGTGNIAPSPYAQIVPSTGSNGALGAYARAVPGPVATPSVAPSGGADSHAVMAGSRMLGRDPDPFIRSQLLRIRVGNYPG